MITDAQTIWTTAIDAVRPERLLTEASIGDRLKQVVNGSDRIVVVGAGKAAAGMAAGVVTLLGADRLAQHRVTGLVSVPEGCGRHLEGIEVRETRPAGLNLPTPAVVRATEEIVHRVSSLTPRDVAIALITGGGSALLAAPRPGVSLEEKIATTRRLSEAGATIAELNAARRDLSLVKGGGLARACAAGRLIVLVLSDVIGNDLDVIASGPCMPTETATNGNWTTACGCRVEHLIVGSNATAAHAAQAEAIRLGYTVMPANIPAEATAEDVCRCLAEAGLAAVAATRHDGQPRAIVSGGEATVRVPADHGRGGRNQQTVLAAVHHVRQTAGGWPAGLVIASVGTDGEDGPTDAAGAVANAAVVAAIDDQGLNVATALARCDAYPLLTAAGGLIHTGPTGTNVADVRIVLAK